MSKMHLRLGILIAAAVVARIVVRDFMTGDVEFWVTNWYRYLLEHGASALGGELPNDEGFKDTWGNYPPSYYYLLYLATFFEGWLPRLYLIKLVSIVFDVVAAGFGFGIVRRVTSSTTTAWWASAAIFAAPTLIANGALWGQCDSIHTSLMLAAVYYSILNRPLATVVSLGIALSFKAQAVFLLPYLLLLMVIGRVPFWYGAVLPLTYAVMMTPAVLLGRSYVDLFLLYTRQGRFFDRLSMMSPNLYYFISNDYYSTGVWVGILVTVVVSLAFAVAALRKSRPVSPRFLLLAATASVAFAPFLLPKMHDRYFMPADLMSIALAFSMPRLWFVAVGFQVSSMFAYVPIITDALNNYDGGDESLMPAAVWINTALVAALLIMYARAVRSRGRGVPESSRPAEVSA